MHAFSVAKGMHVLVNVLVYLGEVVAELVVGLAYRAVALVTIV